MSPRWATGGAVVLLAVLLAGPVAAQQSDGSGGTEATSGETEDDSENGSAILIETDAEKRERFCADPANADLSLCQDDGG